MSNSIINIRFGAWHFHVDRDPFRMCIAKNDYWVKNKPKKFFEVYNFFNYKAKYEY